MTRHAFTVMARRLRLYATAGAGALMLAWTGPAWSADASLSVRRFTGVPRSTVIDLSVSSTTVATQLRLNWTAPSVYPGTYLESYQIRVRAVSAAVYGGSALAWWNDAGGSVLQNFYGESPGAPVTRKLGPPGSSEMITLTAGSTYYIALRSADDSGTDLNFWSGISSPITFFLPAPLNAVPPRRPTAIWGEL